MLDDLFDVSSHDYCVYTAGTVICGKQTDLYEIPANKREIYSAKKLLKKNYYIIFRKTKLL